jgi:hypothetical protein
MSRRYIYYIVYCCICLSGYSCHESVRYQPEHQIVVVDSIRAMHDSIKTVRILDSARGRGPASEEEYSKGSVAYYCPTKMIKGQEYFVTVSISKDSLGKLIQQVKNQIQGVDSAANLADVHGDGILIGERMRVELVVPPDDFKIISPPTVTDQAFLNSQTLEWDWIIEPTAVKNDIQIYIRVSAYNLNGSDTWVEVKHPPKLFQVNIQIDPRDFWDKIIGFLSDNPEFLLAQILIPVLTFFFGWLFGKRKKE